MTPTKCSCGENSDHVIARNKTADGVRVDLWCDGAITSAMGYAFQGVPVARPKTADARACELTAGSMFLGEVELYDSEELGPLHKACRWAAKQGKTVAEMRRHLHEKARPKVHPVWKVLSADRDGNPTERAWILPRMRWAGLVVFDFCNRNPRYELCNVDRHNVATATGFRFRNLDELAAHLHGLPQHEARNCIVGKLEAQR